MKKLFLISIISIAFLSSCGSSDNNKNEASNQEANVSESTVNDNDYVKLLSYKDFIKNVWDIESNANEFIFKGNKPCVIDFYATWCGPCKRVAPIIDKLAQEYNGKVDFYKVDIDQEQKLAMILQIKNIPTIFFFNTDAQPQKTVGAYDEAYYRGIIEKMLNE